MKGENVVKKVILLLVDSLMPNILEDGIRHKTVPALQFLKDRGRYWPDCVTVFPTMTASVDSLLVTGVYPNIHRIPGLIWYNPEEKKSSIILMDGSVSKNWGWLIAERMFSII